MISTILPGNVADRNHAARRFPERQRRGGDERFQAGVRRSGEHAHSDRQRPGDQAGGAADQLRRRVPPAVEQASAALSVLTDGKRRQFGTRVSR
jgi:hypothetical protein